MCARWRPLIPDATIHTPLLAYVCNSARVYFWSPSRSVYWTDLPPQYGQLAVISITWNASGSKLLLQGRESLCLLSVNLEIGMGGSMTEYGGESHTGTVFTTMTSSGSGSGGVEGEVTGSGSGGSGGEYGDISVF